MPREISAGAVIFRKENNKVYYLLLHYGAGHWDFPKGHVENEEKEKDTVKREVKEETGIGDIEIIDGFKEWIKYVYRDTYNLKDKGKAPPARNASHSDAGGWVFKIVTYYLAETKTKEVKISFEHKGFKWLPYEQALEQLTFKEAKGILKKANKFLKGNT